MSICSEITTVNSPNPGLVHLIKSNVIHVHHVEQTTSKRPHLVHKIHKEGDFRQILHHKDPNQHLHLLQNLKARGEGRNTRVREAFCAIFSIEDDSLTAIIPTVAVRQVHTTPTVRMMALLGADTAKSDVMIRTYKDNYNTRQRIMNDGKTASGPNRTQTGGCLNWLDDI